MTTNTLTPDYMDIDFNTAKTNLISLLQANPVFKDVNYEGANITVLIELISYLISLNTYYMNMLAKNQFIPTSNMYETTHMLSQLGGYNPMGYRSSSTTLGIDINISAACADVPVSASAVIIVPEWSEIGNSMGVTNPTTGNLIKFVTVNPTTTYPLSSMATECSSGGVLSAPLTASTYTIPVTAREGYVVRYDYTGADINDYKIVLPFMTYDYDDDLQDSCETIKVFVNDVKWTRLSDWFEESEDVSNAFMFKYDKYGRYYIEFSATRNVPVAIDDIAILGIISSGSDGDVAATIIDEPLSTFLELESGGYLSTSTYTVSNSAASVGGASPESIDEIKNSTIGMLHSQYRNVTKNDYISYLESRADIIQANVWGEQEQSPSGSVQDYNKIYVSLVPSVWNSSTCDVLPSAGATTPLSATAYNETFTSDISEYLKPRKILTTYEQYIVPELLYFTFLIGLKIKPNYTYSSVKATVEEKLRYYFNSYNRTFNERISFIDITEYLLDTSITSSDSDFANIKGLRALIIRDIDVVTYAPSGDMWQLLQSGVYEPNTSELYPYYVESAFSTTTDNKLRTIQLGHNQFPMLYVKPDTFIMEI